MNEDEMRDYISQIFTVPIPDWAMEMFFEVFEWYPDPSLETLLEHIFTKGFDAGRNNPNY